MNPRIEILRRRLRGLTVFFIAGLVFSGVTALPLETELNLLVQWLSPAASGSGSVAGGFLAWLLRVQQGLQQTNQAYPFLAYGTDWLAFAHVVIAVAFLGPLRDPVRNRWIYDFGLIACAMVVPFALLAGQVRGIPLGWRLIDCYFGVFGAMPLWLCRQYARELEVRLTPR